MTKSYGPMFALAFVASFLFTPSLASLSIVGRLTSCPGGSSDQSNFALLAVSEVHNVFQARMTLALGSDGSSGSSGWLGNADTMTSSIISTNFVMNVGGITAITSKGLTAGVSNSVGNESGLLAFTLATNTQLPAPKKGVYCVLHNPDSNSQFPYTLSVNGGDGGNFSLCRLSSGSEFVVVYKAAESSSMSAGYDFESCISVTIAVLPVE